MNGRRSVLVTGGAGFLGAALVRRLVAAGHRVRVLDNESRGSFRRLAEVESETEIVSGDVRDRESVRRATEGIDTLCHLAFVNGTELFYSKPELVLEIGVKGMINVLDASIEHGVGTFLLMSSSEVYQTPPTVPTDETVPLSIPDPLNPRYSYAGGKIASELMAINYGRSHFERVLIVRPHNVYGPDMGNEHVVPQFFNRMTQMLDDSRDPLPFPVQGDGSERRSFVFIDDFTDGLMQVLDAGAHLGIYHIGTEDEVSIGELAALIAAQFKRRIILKPGPPAPGGTARRCPDIAKAAALGYRPSRSLADGIRIFARWHREQRGNDSSARPLPAPPAASPAPQ